jgi:hypothetical protein
MTLWMQPTGPQNKAQYTKKNTATQSTFSDKKWIQIKITPIWKVPKYLEINA